MSRILQIILGVIFFQHLIALLVLLTFLPARIFNFSKHMQKEFSYPQGQQKFESTLSVGPLKLSRTMHYDTITRKGVQHLYAGLPHLVPSMTMDGKPYVRSAAGESVPARYTENSLLEVPISPDRYRFTLILSFVLILVYLAILLYLMVELFRFSKQAGRQDFFNPDNQRRLRIFGAFMLLTTLFSYVGDTSGAWLLQQLTGTTGYRYKLEQKDMGSFPTALVAGLLMFIIANAFGKGRDLQTEQDLTI
jgi:hypothetical protein